MILMNKQTYPVEFVVPIINVIRVVSVDIVNWGRGCG